MQIDGIDTGIQDHFLCICHFSSIEELEIYDTISAADIKGIEANKANQKRDKLCC
jgi:hypothetical protein